MPTSVTRYFRLVIVLSVPFYALSAMGFRLPGVAMLPLSALMAIVPTLAALLVVYWEEGANGAAR